MTRSFEDKPATRERVPLLIGLMGPSGGGKTYSALRLASGIQRTAGGDIYVIDTEARRALHYADRFSFRHVHFQAPFSPLDYLAAIEHCVRKGAGTIIVDSMSHEHEGPGGVLEMHSAEHARLGGKEGTKMLAWAKPKAERRRLINSLTQMQCNFLFCFRAKEKVKLVAKKDRRDGEEAVQALGFMPIAGEEFVFEMTTNCLLLPNANGVPTWRSDEIGERMMIKMPEQFRALLGDGQQLSEDIGAKMAQWAAGGAVNRYSELVAEMRKAGTVADLETLIPSLKEAKVQQTVTPAEYRALGEMYKTRTAEISARKPDDYEDNGFGSAPTHEPETAEVSQ